MNQFVKSVSGWLWSYPMLLMVLGVGIFYLFRLRAVQIRWFGLGISAVRGSRVGGSGAGDVSPFAALMTSVGGIVGSGNVAGVATAITAGGPGALFWMWISALLGGGTMFAEGVLGVRYRERGPDGVTIGGPMYYMRDGLGLKPLAVFYAIGMAIRISFSTTTIQSNSIATVLDSELGVAPWIACLLTAVVTGLVVVGGVRQIGRVMGIIAPVMGAVYLLAALVALVIFAPHVPDALAMVFRHAFTPAAGIGGFAGATVTQAMRFGLARGVYSNEAGTGVAGIAHASAQTDDPIRQGSIAMLGVFIDTIVICSATGLVLLASGAYTTELDSSALTAAAFTQALGPAGGPVVVITSLLFGITTLITCEFYGEQSAVFVFGTRIRLAYRVLFCLGILGGAAASARVIWAWGDLFSALIAIPNLAALVLLGGEVWRLLKHDRRSKPRPRVAIDEL